MSFPLIRLVAVLPMFALPTFGQTTERVSVSSSGQEGNAQSTGAKISGDGRFVSFNSSASNLVPNDTNGVSDVFVRDRLAGTTQRVSVSTAGQQSNGLSIVGDVSLDGRFVVFYSEGTNLGTTPQASGHVYVRDLLTSVTEQVDLSNTGQVLPGFSLLPSLSSDGRFVTFLNRPFGAASERAVVVRDRLNQSTWQWGPTNECWGADGTPGCSDDGRFVALSRCAGPSSFNSIPGAWLQDTLNVETSSPTAFSPGGLYARSAPAAVSANGRYMAYRAEADWLPGDANSLPDVAVFDRLTQSSERVTIGLGGQPANGTSFSIRMTRNSRFVTFVSEATNLVPGDVNGTQDAFLFDRVAHEMKLISLAADGSQAANFSGNAAGSEDGRLVAFDSLAGNLVQGDTNGVMDVFVRDMGFAPPSSYCVAKVNSQGCTPAIGWTGTPSVSSPDDFHVTASQVRNASPGIMFWGTAPAAVPFAGGTRCVQAPLIRTDVSYSGGSTFPSADCSGTYDFHFSHAYMASFFLATGTTVHAQFWQRDSIHPDGTGQGLTDGLRFTITP